MPIPVEVKTPIYFVRRGTLYGAAVGVLCGLVAVGWQDLTELAAIEMWRNWILGGAFVGLVAGTIRAVRMRTNSDKDRDV